MNNRTPTTFESYGAHLRNLLGPYQNLVCLVDGLIDGSISIDTFKKLASNQQAGVDSIIEFSNDEMMEKMNWRRSKFDIEDDLDHTESSLATKVKHDKHSVVVNQK